MSSITVNKAGIKFSFLDSGAPSQSASYVTIIAVHGMGFASPVFKRVQRLAPNSNVRFVAVNRRGYEGSTHYSESELAAIVSGTDAEKAEFLNARGVELALFVDLFIQQNKIPRISDDGKSGGVSLLGWSAGNGVLSSAIANVDKLSAEAQSRFAAYIRAFVMHEPPSIVFGLPLPPKNWSPHMDTTIPADEQVPMYTRWITSYFDHGDLSTRNIDVLSYILPSVRRAPSIYNMSAQEITEMVDEGPTDLFPMFMSMPQAHDIYVKACFDRTARALVPKMKISLLTGDVTCSFSLAGFWSIQDDDKSNGDGQINFVVIPGVNHFMHWDEPEKALKAYIDATLL